jgi:aminoglycoside 3-N-acetyltransferase I
MPVTAYPIRQLGPGDFGLLSQLNVMFGQAFGEPESYTAKPPSPQYLERLLESDTFLAVVAMDGENIIGGIAAYELKKFEQERSEIYIYDLAVADRYRRQGVATGLIRHLRAIAVARGAHALFVQADTTQDDLPAIALYSKLGRREEVLHFDIELNPS